MSDIKCCGIIALRIVMMTLPFMFERLFTGLQYCCEETLEWLDDKLPTC